MIKKKILNLI